MKSWRSLVAVLGTAALTLTACAGGASNKENSGTGEQVTLTLMRTGTPEILRPIFEPMIAKFEEANPGIKVDMQDLGWNDATTSIGVMASSGTLPDLMYHLPSEVFDLASKGLVTDLTNKLSPKLKEDIFPALLQAGQYEGKQYLVPAGVSPLFLWYNAELFEKAGLDPDNPPKTWEDLLAAGRQIAEKTDASGIALFSKPGGGETSGLYESLFAGAIGGSAWDPQAKRYLYDDSKYDAKALQTLKFMRELVDIAQPNVVEYGRFDTRTLFRDGQVGMAFDLIHMQNQIRDGLKDGKFRVAELPAPMGQTSTSAISAGGWFIPTNSAHPEEAMKLLEFFMETENQIKHTAYGSAPILKSEAATYQGELWKVATAALEHGVVEGISLKTGALWTVNGEELQQLLTAQKSPEDVLQAMRERHQEIYE
ncbi:ABC transporter substrate-binding protein [Schaalia sp. lx-100]|uniref:ABC transporter substrate-binding protein n=1 Tax=Schaalia sp. lx-100 TaxID=2899081 RepID=UPI001E2AACCD|nr:sugar ABC transporter substrate-binding protein [Schaalia sp. lx-100]MCD4557748.1 sugar ABC transporter substrate-binding protein [Schaalia sp. lx-100]